MAAENYTSWSPGETDPSAKFTVGANAITGDALILRDYPGWHVNDFGVNFFSGDFIHLIDTTWQAASGTNGQGVIWTVQNSASGTPIAIENAGGDVISVRWQSVSSTNYYIGIRDDSGTPANSGNLYVGGAGDRYWLEIERDEAASTYGDLIVRIYSDSGRSTLVETISISLSAKKDFRYVNVYGGINTTSSTQQMQYDVGALDIQEVAGAISATTDALKITENAATVEFGVKVSATRESLKLKEYDATITVGSSTSVTATRDSLVINEHDATIEVGVSVQSSKDSLVLTEYPATVSFGAEISVTRDHLVFTEHAATVTYGVNVLATRDSLKLNEFSATIGTGVPISFTDLRDESGTPITGTVLYVWYPGIAQVPGNLTATAEEGTITANSGAGNITDSITTGAGWLYLHYDDGSSWQTHGGVYTAS